MICQVSVFKLGELLLCEGQLALVCHNLEDAAIWMEDKDADTYSTHRTASKIKELSSPSVNSTKVEKPQFRYFILAQPKDLSMHIHVHTHIHIHSLMALKK